MEKKETSKAPLPAIVICIVIATVLLLVKVKPELFESKKSVAVSKSSSALSESDIYGIRDYLIKVKDQGNFGIVSIDRRDTDSSIRYLVSLGRVLETYEMQGTTTKINEATIVLEANRKSGRGQIYFKAHKDARPEVAETAFVVLMQTLAQGANVDWASIYRTEVAPPIPDDFKYYPVGPMLASILPSAALTFDGHEKVLRLFGGDL